jgi:hypothetical protein
MLWLFLLGCGDAPVVPIEMDAGGADHSVDNRHDEAGAPLSRFVTKVIDFQPGDCAGFGATSMPDIVYGPPRGAGEMRGSLDVVSLGVGGMLTVGFEPTVIADGPGVDFIVFENAFWIGGNPSTPFAEPAEISVSDDGVTWIPFACSATQNPYGACSGWKPVYSNPNNDISPFDVARSGGEAYDLADVGVKTARFVRIRDQASQSCPADPSQRPNTLGHDLDSIAVLNVQP